MTVAVHGASGRLGALIMAESAGMVVPIPRGAEVPECDVVIDVTSAQGLTELIPRLSGQALVVGSTGALPWEALERYARTSSVVVVPNFSVGVAPLIEQIRQAIPSLPPGWDIEVVEAHHHHKKDAPSGTATRLVRAITEAGGPSTVPTHSLRVGDTVGEHTVWLCGPGERIELKHVATRRSVFAIGALRWAEWILNQPVGLFRP